MDVDMESGGSGGENSPNNTPVPENDDTPKVDPLKWSVSILNLRLFVYKILSNKI